MSDRRSPLEEEVNLTLASERLLKEHLELLEKEKARMKEMQNSGSIPSAEELALMEAEVEKVRKQINRLSQLREIRKGIDTDETHEDFLEQTFEEMKEDPSLLANTVYSQPPFLSMLDKHDGSYDKALVVASLDPFYRFSLQKLALELKARDNKMRSDIEREYSQLEVYIEQTNDDSSDEFQQRKTSFVQKQTELRKDFKEKEKHAKGIVKALHTEFRAHRKAMQDRNEPQWMIDRLLSGRIVVEWFLEYAPKIAERLGLKIEEDEIATFLIANSQELLEFKRLYDEAKQGEQLARQKAEQLEGTLVQREGEFAAAQKRLGEALASSNAAFDAEKGGRAKDKAGWDKEEAGYKQKIGELERSILDLRDGITGLERRLQETEAASLEAVAAKEKDKQEALRQLDEKYAGAIADRQNAHEKALAEITADYSKRLAERDADKKKSVDELVARQREEFAKAQKELADLKKEYDEEKTRLQSKYDADTALLNADKEKAVAAATKEYNGKLSEAVEGTKKKLEELTAKYEKDAAAEKEKLSAAEKKYDADTAEFKRKHAADLLEKDRVLASEKAASAEAVGGLRGRLEALEREIETEYGKNEKLADENVDLKGKLRQRELELANTPAARDRRTRMLAGAAVAAATLLAAVGIYSGAIQPRLPPKNDDAQFASLNEKLEAMKQAAANAPTAPEKDYAEELNGIKSDVERLTTAVASIQPGVKETSYEELVQNYKTFLDRYAREKFIDNCKPEAFKALDNYIREHKGEVLFRGGDIIVDELAQQLPYGLSNDVWSQVNRTIAMAYIAGGKDATGFRIVTEDGKTFSLSDLTRPLPKGTKIKLTGQKD